jgi:hypothetical protein
VGGKEFAVHAIISYPADTYERGGGRRDLSVVDETDEVDFPQLLEPK